MSLAFEFTNYWLCPLRGRVNNLLLYSRSSNFPFESCHMLIAFCLMLNYVQVYGALRMSVKMFLMWNSQLLVDGGGDITVATSLLEASNLLVLRVYSWHVFFFLVFVNIYSFIAFFTLIDLPGIILHTL